MAFDPTTYFDIGGAFDGISGGIYRTTDFTGTNIVDVSPPGFDRTNNFYQDINFDTDGLTGVAVGNLISTTSDGGATWQDTNVNDITGNLLLGESSQHSIAFSPTTAVAVGEYNAFGSGHIGAAYWASKAVINTWHRVQIGTPNDFACYGIAYGMGAFCATTTGGIMRSIDEGQTWTLVVNDGNWNVIVFANGLFVAICYEQGGPKGDVSVSADGGATWQNVTPGIAVTFGNVFGQWLIFDPDKALWVLLTNFTGDNSEPQIWTAPDALDWTVRFTGAPQGVGVGPDIYSGLTQIGSAYITTGSYRTGPASFIPTMARPTVLSDPTGSWDRTLPSNALADSFGYSWGKPNVGILTTSDKADFSKALLDSTDDAATFNAVAGVPAGFYASFFVVWAFAANPGPTPLERCVDFEIQSPGDMPDSGQQFTGQRLLLTLNTAVEGLVPQLLTPTLIVDGVEHTLPPVSANGRQTLDIPIYGLHGTFFDGVRLTGCLTGARVEVFRVEATVYLGDTIG